MARLAIRATGDKSRRENVTTGEKQVCAGVHVGNKHVAHVTLWENSIGKLVVRVEKLHKSVHVSVHDKTSETHAHTWVRVPGESGVYTCQYNDNGTQTGCGQYKKA